MLKCSPFPECRAERFQLCWQSNANDICLRLWPHRNATQQFDYGRFRYTNLFNYILYIHFVSFRYQQREDNNIASGLVYDVIGFGSKKKYGKCECDNYSAILSNNNLFTFYLCAAEQISF